MIESCQGIKEDKYSGIWECLRAWLCMFCPYILGETEHEAIETMLLTLVTKLLAMDDSELRGVGAVRCFVPSLMPSPKHEETLRGVR